MSVHHAVPRVTVPKLQERARAGEKLVMLTCYDASFAAISEAAGVDLLLIGDSLGMVVQGRDSTLAVKLEDTEYHVRCVARGSERALVIADLPFLSGFQASPERAFRAASRMLAAGAQMVKLEGGAHMAEATRFLVDRGIPVCAHIGLTPQLVNTLGGYRVQGRDETAAARVLDEARRLEDAGAFSVVLELVPAELAARVTEALSIPTIGIGAGAGCSGQVLVLPDLLGLNDRFAPKFLKRYGTMGDDVRAAVRRFAGEVRDGSYPDADHSF